LSRNAHKIGGRELLDNETLFRHVPSIFACEAHDRRPKRTLKITVMSIVEDVPMLDTDGISAHIKSSCNRQLLFFWAAAQEKDHT